jgi:tRNA threonylcarbamoyladenosine biosynthesis protein TsaE
MAAGEVQGSVPFGQLDEPGLIRFGARLAACLRAPLVVYLVGDLGAGKTTLTRALVQSLGHAGRVKSPTYGLLERYELQDLDVLHLDLYRIGDPGELEFIGIEDLIDERTLLLIEWPERGRGFLPAPDLVVALEHSGDTRFVYLQPHSPPGQAVCEALTEPTSR